LLVSPSERNNAAVWIWFRISVSGGEGRKRAMAAGIKFGRKRKLSDYQRAEAIKRRAAGETLASIAKSYGVHIAMISRL
jgi:DNA invertase Pin-like site-specific DNA recombinase